MLIHFDTPASHGLSSGNAVVAGPEAAVRARQGRRRAAEQLGRHAEAAAEAYWVGRGYHTLARRLRTGAGELDLVMADREHLVFVEVKARRCAAAAAYAVSRHQQMRLFSAAEAALAEHGDWWRPNVRFDVALVCGGRVESIEDALRLN
jgi:putative endonuclease